MTKFMPTASIVAGDTIRWTEAVFSGGSFGRYRRKAAFEGERSIVARVLKESYGAENQQHTFTLEVISAEGVEAPSAGETIRRKGRNIYRSGVERLPWADEAARGRALAEKHARGDAARAARDARRSLEERPL